MPETEREPYQPDESVMELYHQSSSLTRSDVSTFKRIAMINEDAAVRRVISSPFPGFARSEKTPLPERVQHGREFLNVLDGRRSVREFDGRPISLAGLANVLRIGDGVTGCLETPDGVRWPVRSAPSPGGLFPTRIYCAALAVDGLPRGLHFYNVADGALEFIQDTGSLREALSHATAMTATFRTAACCLVLTSDLGRMRFKYGERSYRFALLEAGHIAQNVLLGAAYEGLSAVVVGGFIDEEIRGACVLRGPDELPLYLIAIGHRGS